jgi:hypothetical protein
MSQAEEKSCGEHPRDARRALIWDVLAILQGIAPYTWPGSMNATYPAHGKRAHSGGKSGGNR